MKFETLINIIGCEDTYCELFQGHGNVWEFKDKSAKIEILDC